jgi:hypothetical protein
MRVGGRAREGRSPQRLRPPRNHLSAAAVGVAVALAITPAGAAAQRCQRADDVTLAANSHARVVGDWIDCDDQDGRSYFDVRAGLRGGTLRSLDYLGEDEITIHSLKLRGRYVAYVSGWNEGEEEASVFSVMNVRTGAIHELDAVSYSAAAPWGGYVLKPNGSSAWIVDEAYGDEFGPETAVVVRRCPRASCLRAGSRRRPVTVDDSPRIALHSLRLTGSKLSWIRAGIRRRATLR